VAEQSDRLFAGSIPELYHRHLGPVIFEPYALSIAGRARALAPRRVLELAAGTGIATRALAACLPEAEIVATDLNQPMLDFAAMKMTSPRVLFRQADAQALPFDDDRFDIVVCQFGVMFFPDRIRAFQECERVLKPGGRYLFQRMGRYRSERLCAYGLQGPRNTLPQRSAALPDPYALWPSRH
jgi:ubiquinone/menaquinone biosynthesis C-methylase UbiE